MNREETKEKLEEAAELVSTHLGDTDQAWEIKDKVFSNKKNVLILTFEVEYEEDEKECNKSILNAFEDSAKIGTGVFLKGIKGKEEED